MGFGELSRKRDKLRGRCKVLERKNFNVEKELAEL